MDARVAPSNWTPDALARLWKAGDGAPIIADRLNELSGARLFTRRAVIGKAHRLKLPARPSHSAGRRYLPGRRCGRRRSARIVQPTSPRSRLQVLFATQATDVAVEQIDIPRAERRTVLTLEYHHFRWPIGDPRRPEFAFCGAPRISGLPDCGRHARRALRPPKPRPRSQLSTNVTVKVTNSVPEVA
jgi:GcrA cell cycle regulator